MLSYAFTEEQEDLRAMVREFANGEIAPLVEEAERTETFPVQVLPMLGELGLLGIVFPEEYGGIGADKITECVFVEEMAKVCAGITASVNAHADLAAFPIYKFGTDAQRERFLKPMVAGDIYPSVGLTEPEVAGSDPTQMRTTAVLDGEEWVVNGHKWFISNARRASSPARRPTAASRSASPSPDRSSTGSTKPRKGAITCTGEPSTSAKTVRSASCLRTISPSARSSAATSSAPHRRHPTGRL